MNVLRALLSSVIASGALFFSPACLADWADAQVLNDAAVVRPQPNNFQIQAQNPPGLQWPRHPSRPASYMLEITGPNGVMPLIPVYRHWYLPATRLAAGSYSWRVRPANTTDWTSPRRFVINASSPVFEVPDDETLHSRTLSRTRPRMLPVNFQMYKDWTPAQVAERGAAYAAMRNDVAWRITGMTDVADSEWQVYSATENSAAKAAQSVKMGQRLSTAGRQLESAALLYRLTADPQYLREAIRRGDALAALSVTGPTSYSFTDQGSRQIALSLAKGLDVLWNDLNPTDPNRRQRWINAVASRTQQMYLDLSGNDNRLDLFPYDSHGGSNLGYLAVIASLTLGSFTEAESWFKFAMRAYAHQIMAWSGSEGGFANGTAYSTYTAAIALQLWQPIHQATGLNLFSKPWSGGFLSYLMQFLPPGSIKNAFGDEHELKPDMATIKAFASRFSTPEAAWYVRALTGTEEPATLLQAPYPLPVSTVTTPAVPPNAKLFPSIGWVAMHSNISDLKRTSVFFKSSPYGAYNHSHGDQNGILLFSGGVPLLIEAGYEDYYGSPMAANWYRQTKAHNAVTYNGGIGQLITGNVENLVRNGMIVGFSASKNIDFAEGNAQPAYGSAVSTARRQLWYVRNSNAVVVRDILAAPVARQFEWNFHAPTLITNSAAGEYKITNGTASVCVRSIGTTPVVFAKWTGTAPLAGTIEDHAAFKLPAATSAEFLVLLDVGCRRPAVKLVTTATGQNLTIGADTIVIGR